MTDYDWTPHLEDGERLLWQGRPEPRLQLILSDMDFAIVPVTMLLALLVFMGEPGPLLGWTTFLVPKILALAILGWVVFGRALMDRHWRGRARYAVTDRQVLVADARTGVLWFRVPITPSLQVTIERGVGETLRLRGGSPLRMLWMRGIIRDRSHLTEALLFGRPYGGVELRDLPNGAEVAALIRQLRNGIPAGQAERRAPLGD